MQCRVGVVRVGLSTNCSAVILMLYASRSCRRLHVGMLFAGDLQGFVGTNRKLCAHGTSFSSFLFPDHGTHMSFAAWGHKVHMVFIPLDLPSSEMVVNGDHMNGVHWHRLTSGAHSCKSIRAGDTKCLAERAVCSIIQKKQT